MTKICRFAPSPTGFLHVGNIRAAIINYLFAKKNNGKFLLRLDDTDDSRVTDEYRQMIFEDMSWLGLDATEISKQSDRLERYEEAKNKLIAAGRLYECFESDAELKLQRKAQIASGLRPLYNRDALNLTEEQKNELRNSGVKSYYRFLLNDETTSWDDKIKGNITFEGRHFSDPVLIRDNGIPTYTFCSVVDDIDMNVTDIIRGEDHITNTAIQIQIFESLGGKAPDFSHLALVKAREGKISKREGGFDIKSLRHDGYEAMSIINLLSQIGASGSIKINKNFDELLADFSLDRFSKSSTNYEISELITINQKLLQKLEFAEIKDRLQKLAPDLSSNILEKFWNMIRGNITYFNDVKEWLDICFKENKFEIAKEDAEFLAKAASKLPENTSDENCWNEWINAIKTQSNRKGKELFMPLRLSLSGKKNGPELKYLINLVSREEILRRLG